MTRLWNCPPSVFEQQTEESIDLAVRIYNQELKAQQKEQRRANQKVSTQ